MLNRAKVLKALQEVSTEIFSVQNSGIETICRVWHELARDVTFVHRTQQAGTGWTLPHWQGLLDAVSAHEPMSDPYHVYGVDGSQIYPDRHVSAACYVINVGIASFAYRIPEQSLHLDSTPYVLVPDKESDYALSPDVVNGMREEYELRAGLEWGKAFRQAHDYPLLFLCDGTLIFWFVESSDQLLRDRFLTQYMSILDACAHEHIPVAGYLSFPRHKEVVQLVHYAVDHKIVDVTLPEAAQRVTDAQLMSHLLAPLERSTVFRYTGSLADRYTPLCVPHFFYLHTGAEIARVELPAWIATDEPLLDTVVQMVIDQSHKGDGYPVALAEAHEQAVIKGPDREFFYHLVQKMGVTLKSRIAVSQKSLKKRGMRM